MLWKEKIPVFFPPRIVFEGVQLLQRLNLQKADLLQCAKMDAFKRTCSHHNLKIRLKILQEGRPGVSRYIPGAEIQKVAIRLSRCHMLLKYIYIHTVQIYIYIHVYIHIHIHVFVLCMVQPPKSWHLSNLSCWFWLVSCKWSIRFVSKCI